MSDNMDALNNKTFLKMVGGLFAFTSAIHLVRILFSWDMILGKINIPFSWSYYFAFIFFILSAISFSLIGMKPNKKKRK